MEGQRRSGGRREASARTAWRIASLAVAACVARPRVARCDDIADLVSQNRSLEALPLAIAAARAHPADTDAWRRALQIALWNSRDDAALEALVALVALAPADRASRFELARRLLWARRLRDAEPHARWLAADPGADAASLEVSFWVLSGLEDRVAARGVARRWIELAPRDARPRWALADVTHWSSAWREAREQYVALAAMPSEAARAGQRADLLRREHPDEVTVEATAWCDSIGVQYVSGSVGAGLQLPGRWVVRARGEGGRWSQGGACDVLTRTAPNSAAGLPATLGVANIIATVRHELSDGLQPELQLGVEADERGNVAPIATLGVRVSVAGRLFGRVWLQHDRYRASLASAHDDVRAIGGAFALYAEPWRWAFASSEGSAWWLDDDNVRVRGLLAVGVHNVGRWQIEPRLFAVVEWFRDQRPVSRPYFTPTDPLSLGGDLTARYAPTARARFEVSGGAIVQAGQAALRGTALARFDIGSNARFSLSGGYVGSPLYRQIRADLGFSWVF